MPIDAILAEIVNATTTPNELTGPEHADRLTQIRALVDLHAGRYEPPANRASDGIRALNWLISQGLCPRTRSTIERRVIRELTNLAPLKAERALWNQAQTLHLLMELFRETPPLADDIEMLETLEQRALRLINPESVAEAISQCRLPSEKVRTLVRIVDLMPYVASKAKMTEFVRAAWSPDDLVRESGGKDRPAALPVLVGMHRDISGAEMDAETKARLLARSGHHAARHHPHRRAERPQPQLHGPHPATDEAVRGISPAGRQGAGLRRGSGRPRGQQPGIPGAVHEAVQGGSGTQTGAAVAAQPAEDIGAGIAVMR